jgi:prepilin peptidase CpaA
MTATIAAFGALLLAASWSDVLKLRIPNAIPLAIVLLFAVELLLGGRFQDPLAHVQAMGLALVILVPLFALDLLGGGDVKLLAAVALWLGMSKLAPLLILVGLAGGLFAAVWLALRWLLRRALPGRALPESMQAGAPLPFALPIMIAALPLAAAG